jgi:hypothetical protein
VQVLKVRKTVSYILLAVMLLIGMIPAVMPAYSAYGDGEATGDLGGGIKDPLGDGDPIKFIDPNAKITMPEIAPIKFTESEKEYELDNGVRIYRFGFNGMNSIWSHNGKTALLTDEYFGIAIKGVVKLPPVVKMTYEAVSPSDYIITQYYIWPEGDGTNYTSTYEVKTGQPLSAECELTSGKSDEYQIVWNLNNPAPYEEVRNGIAYDNGIKVMWDDVAKTLGEIDTVEKTGKEITAISFNIGTVGAGGTVKLDPEVGAGDPYWVGDSGDWSDAANHWSNESGGTPNASFLPDASSAVNFDVNSFSTTGQTVNVDADSYCGDMSWVGANYSPSFNASHKFIWVTGNITMISDMSVHFVDEAGILIYSATTANYSIDIPLYFEGGFGFQMLDNGSVSLQADLNISSFFLCTGGGLTTNNYNISTSFMTDNEAHNYVTLNLGSSVINTSTTGWYMGAEETVINAGTSTIILNEGTAQITEEGDLGSYFFGGFSNTYHNIIGNGSSHVVVGDNTIESFNLSPDVTQRVLFGDGQTQTVASASLSGSDGHMHTLTSFEGTEWYIAKSGGGTVSVDYLNISYSNASPDDTWCYGENSIYGDGNSGWYECAGEAVSISVSPTSKDFGKMYEGSDYWSNGSQPEFPLDDAECYFTITNEGSASINISINASNFTGGDGWLLTSGTPEDGEARMLVAVSGCTDEAEMIILTTSPQALIDGLAGSDTIMWELKLETGMFTDGVIKESHITLVAVEDI